MGYTRYWETTGNKYDQRTIEIIKKIIEIAEKEYDIVLRSHDGTGEPIVNEEYIGINGDAYNELSYESFVIINGEDTGFNFCKTARQPYDIAINAILQLMKQQKIISKYRSDGNNKEKLAKELLKKAIKEANKKYILEAYDKDHDIYETLAEHKEIDTLKNIVNIIMDGVEPRMENGEPVDWFLITDNDTGTPIWYFDMYETKWKEYQSPPTPNKNTKKEGAPHDQS